jgi:hypothetical protein
VQEQVDQEFDKLHVQGSIIRKRLK